MNKIAVFFKLPNPMDYPFSKPDYWQSYQEFSAEVSRQGGELYFVRRQESYLGEGAFSQSWRIIDGTVVETGPVTVSAVFDKGRFKSDNTIPVLNPEVVSQFCVDKWQMYQQLRQYCPLTFKVESSVELAEALAQITTAKVVFKPVKGSEGHGIHIEEKSFFTNADTQLVFPALVQEFMDTSPGIPGIMQGMHDFRVALFDGEVTFAYVRTPPEGSLLANIAQGGSLTMVDPKDVPAEIVEICKTVDLRFVDCAHRFYSIDFGYTSEGPKIIEMNSQVGLFPDSWDPIFITFKQKLAKVLLSY